MLKRTYVRSVRSRVITAERIETGNRRTSPFLRVMCELDVPQIERFGCPPPARLCRKA